MALSGIDEVVGLGAGVFAGAEEGEGVLEHAGGVVVADDDLSVDLCSLAACSTMLASA